MEQMQGFLQEQWMVILGAVVVLVLVVKLVKAAIKWAIILAIAAAVIVYGANYKDTLTSIKDAVVESAGSAIAETVKAKAAEAIQSEAKEAKFTQNDDGTFTIRTKTIQMDGTPGSDKVTVTVAGQSFEMSLVGAVESFINQAKQNP